MSTTIAADKNAIKQRMDEYLWQRETTSALALRKHLKKYFFHFEHVAIIGGMVRDIARAGGDSFKSDVDLVIDAPPSDVANFATRMNATPNRFGGYSFTEDCWKFDFWALETTWAHRAGHANITKLEDITNCTFFDCDAILYDLKTKKVICSDNYLDRLRSSTIEISLMHTPSITGNLLRAIRRILLWNLNPGPKLQDFILQNLDDKIFAEISDRNKRIYSCSLIKKTKNANTLIECIKNAEKRIEILNNIHTST